MKLYFFSVLAFAFTAHAQTPSTAPVATPVAAPLAAPAPAANIPVKYFLRNLKASGISQYALTEKAGLRLYLHFHNEQGHHYIVYEEATAAPQQREVNNLRQAMANPHQPFSLDIECAAKAFCTGECRNMYYEMSNQPGEYATTEQNRCEVKAFTNEMPTVETRTIASSTPVPVTQPAQATQEPAAPETQTTQP